MSRCRGLFSVSIWARSSNDDIDLETLVGQDAALRAAGGTQHALVTTGRCWSGIVSHLEFVHAEPIGQSTYYLRIVLGCGSSLPKSPELPGNCWSRRIMKRCHLQEE